MDRFDFIVVGAGISGAAAAAALAEEGRVALVEAESAPGLHSTGRSAALYTPNYGGPVARRLNVASGAFYGSPPEGFADHPLLSPRGALTLAMPGQEHLLEPVLANANPAHPIERVTPARAAQMAAFLRPDFIAAAVHEAGVMDMDVAATHQGFLRSFRQRGGVLHCKAPVQALRRAGGAWQVKAGAQDLEAPVVVNASGAWGDVVGGLAGATPVGLVPKRRTAVLVDPPAGMDVSAMPVIEFAGHGPYMKPQGAAIMASPADETPDTPRDVQPDDMDVAVLVDWIERHSFVTVHRAPRTWAGLRSFVRDGAPVVGFDPGVEGFFWLVGQGGFGIMMAPVLARIAAALACGAPVPADLAARGITADDLSPGRPGLRG
jgi:D-arginine dehydrogenase